MDVICPVCLEPWDLDSLHEVVQEGDFPDFDAAWAAFLRKGCEAFGSWGAKHSETADAEARAEVRTVYDLLGNDPDGCVAQLQDLGY